MHTTSTLVIAATDTELSWLTTRLDTRPDRPLLDFPVRRASGGSAGIWLVTSGPGMANAAAACAAAIERFQPLRIFNTGICGVYAQDRTLLGTAVTGEQAIFADTGAVSVRDFTSLRDMDLRLASPAGNDIFNILKLDCAAAPKDIVRADFLTVAAVSGSRAAADKLRRRFPPAAGTLLCEDMESAAVGLVALRAGIPCTVVRGISNLCGERDHGRWDIRGAARSAQETLYTLVSP